VNGDDPEAVVHACQLAAEWRQTFHKDVVVDIVCYRKFGHNEGDEPRFTQPLMYKQIEKQKPILDQYVERLLKEGVITKEKVQEITNKVQTILNNAFNHAPDYRSEKTEWYDSVWKDFKSIQQLQRIRNTGVNAEILKKIGVACATVPDDFRLHPKVSRIMQERKTMMETGENIDWGTAEVQITS
jgi:2-oxoglutarate dehydrogenase E1 component